MMDNVEEALQFSRENSKKLDTLLAVIQGIGPHDAGLVGKVERHELLLFGNEDKAGIATKVNIIWRIHVWLLCSLSGFIGAILTWILKK